MQKFKFDASLGSTPSNNDFFANPWRYSFVHNFKVHYKVSMIQALANKVDVSVSSDSPQIPSTKLALDEFNQRMIAGNVTRNARMRFSAASYHVSNVEYKESFAFFDPHAAPEAPPTIYSNQGTPQTIMTQGARFCIRCGTQLGANSRFCGSCGAAVGT